MGLETTATYVDSLNQLWPNPLLGDKLDQADDHLRLIKAAIQRTFPNVAGVVSASNAEMGHLIGVNQHPQVQFDNLREGSATANAAINALYANSASYAENASTVSYAAVALNRGVQYIDTYGGGGLTGGLTCTASFATVADVSLSASGIYRIRAEFVCTVNYQGASADSIRFRLEASTSSSVTINYTLRGSALDGASSILNGERAILQGMHLGPDQAPALATPGAPLGAPGERYNVLATGILDIHSNTASGRLKLKVQGGGFAGKEVIVHAALLRMQRMRNSVFGA